VGKQFANRVVIVTGGSQGIGRSIANYFCEEAARVILLDMNEAMLQEAKEFFKDVGCEVQTKVVNVTDPGAVETAVQEIYEVNGAIDILVNNAGIIRDNLLFNMTDTDWQQVLDVHLNGTFYMSRSVQSYMVKQQYGRIINISSTSALGNRGQANYAAAKAGIQGFTKTLAMELGRFGITTNCVAPGFIETDMTRRTAERLGISFDDFIAEGIKTIPVNRTGTPEDVAHAVAFFADERSSFVNGQVMYVAGGPKNSRIYFIHVTPSVEKCNFYREGDSVNLTSFNSQFDLQKR